MLSSVHPYPGATLLITRTVGATVVLSAVHVAVDRIVGRRLAEKHKLNPAERIFVSEKVCSTLNAVFTTVIGIKSLFLFKNAAGRIVDPYAFDWVFPAYVGYTLYDMCTMAVQNPPSHWTMWVHHVMGAYGGLAMMFGRQISIFPAYCMITESTAIFHNLLWYYQTFIDRPIPTITDTPYPPPTPPIHTPNPPSPPPPSSSDFAQHPSSRYESGMYGDAGVGVGSFVKAAGRMVGRCLRETPWWVGVPGLVMVGGFAVLNVLWTGATVKVFLRAAGVVKKKAKVKGK
ncbi:hypothetical protein BC829DRAFT_446489 [Chytridium lagenaria]|nr:hypothetical protein BC829DRAFT_446489 [Chytridium lagenaria]